jgi:PAS domain S-box-containing protein
MKHVIQLESSELNITFPFFLFFNKEMLILDAGISMQKIAPECINKPLLDVIEIVRPSIIPSTHEALLPICHRLAIIKLTSSEIVLRGQFEFIPRSDHFVFLGSPWFDSTDELDKSGLKFRDFAPHNPLIDLLHVLSAQQIANQELKELLNKVNKQKDDLADSQKQLKRLSESLEESNLRYSYVNKATSEAIWDWDVVRDQMFYGDGYQKLFGYPASKNWESSNFWEDRIHPEDKERVSESMDEFLISKLELWESEYRYLKADGNYAYVSDKSYAIRNDAGVAIRMIGSMQDITVRKEEEEALKILESAISNIHDSVLIASNKPNFPIVYANQAFISVSGYNWDEIKGQNPIFLLGKNVSPKFLHEIRSNMFAGIGFETVVENFKKDQTPYWVEFSISPVLNKKGEITHWIGIQRDITEIKEANDEIIRQKKFNEDILNNIPTDIAVFDPEHRYLFINHHAIKNKDIRHWMIGKNDFEYANYRNISDEFAQKRWKLFDEAVQKRETIKWIDEHKTESRTTYLLRTFYPYFEEDELKYVIGYGVDITERKLIEIRLIDALQSVKKINDELEQFAYVASHDLQEPLRMVTSFLTQLEKKYSEQLEERGREYIHYAVDGAKRMRQIILDLLEYSRIGKVNEPLKEISIGEIVEEVKLLHQKQIQELQANISYTSLPVLKAHRTPIRQLFQNLISNGLKYHHKGKSPEIEITCSSTDEEWRFCISDNGIGIEPIYYEKIFSIFQRLHNREEYSGTGIGLAITKKIVEHMGGKIWVESTLGEGSRFYFTIPFPKTSEASIISLP